MKGGYIDVLKIWDTTAVGIDDGVSYQRISVLFYSPMSVLRQIDTTMKLPIQPEDLAKSLESMAASIRKESK